MGVSEAMQVLSSVGTFAVRRQMILRQDEPQDQEVVNHRSQQPRG